MKLPDLSHLQFVVLAEMLQGKRSGGMVRGVLKRYRVRQSGPAFYQMMARLETAGVVEGWYEKQTAGGQSVKERWYRITADGRRAWRASRRFYEQTIEAADGEGLAPA
jgi:DNA-binding PadR family transcriptional regulator